MLIANSKRFGREQIQIYIPALCPRVLDLPNTCPFSKVTLACGTFPYLSRALPACFGVNYIHKNGLMEPWGSESILMCMCVYVCLPVVACVCLYVVLSVVVFTVGAVEKGKAVLQEEEDKESLFLQRDKCRVKINKTLQ